MDEEKTPLLHVQQSNTVDEVSRRVSDQEIISEIIKENGYGRFQLTCQILFTMSVIPEAIAYYTVMMSQQPIS